jgi:hypothetical protein
MYMGRQATIKTIMMMMEKEVVEGWEENEILRFAGDTLPIGLKFEVY